MTTRPTYRWLEARPEKRTVELFIRGTRIRCTDIWYDRFVNDLEPEAIAQGRTLELGAVLEALDFCERYWPAIQAETEERTARLQVMGFFDRPTL